MSINVNFAHKSIKKEYSHFVFLSASDLFCSSAQRWKWLFVRTWRGGLLLIKEKKLQSGALFSSLPRNILWEPCGQMPHGLIQFLQLPSHRTIRRFKAFGLWHCFEMLFVWLI